MDITDDSNPVLVGSAALPTGTAAFVLRDSTIITRDGIVYVVNEEDYERPLEVYPFVPNRLIDATRKNIYMARPDAPYGELIAHERNYSAQPVSLITANANYRFDDWVQYEELIYTANGPDGIKKFGASTTDLTTGALPVLAQAERHTAFDDPQSIDITKEGDVLVTAAGSDGFRLHRASDLSLLGTYSVPGRVIYNVRFLTSLVGVAVFGDELITLDVSDRSNPKLLGNVTVQGRRLQIGGNFAYVFNTDADTMDVINLNVPSTPTFVRRIDQMRKSCINGTLLYRVIPDGIATVVAHDLTNIVNEPPRQFDSIPVITPEISVVSCSHTTENRQDMVVQWFDGTLSDHNVKPVIRKQFDIARVRQTSSKVFEFNSRLMTRTQAADYCAGRRIDGQPGKLASIRNQDENDAVRQFNTEDSSQKQYWISLSQADTQCHWTWADGLSFLTNSPGQCTLCASGQYCNFKSGQEESTEPYRYFDTDGTWAAAGDASLFHPVCEWSKPECAGSVSYDGIRYTYNPLPAGIKMCRAADGACDQAEYCDGNLVTCPNDFVKNTSQVCRAGSNACDADETCDGLSKECPVDKLAPAGTLCRQAVGKCDEPEFCSGQTSECPADVIKPVGFLCSPKLGDCDIEEVCDGSSGLCPTNVFEPSSKQCRAKNGECDKAEFCSGFGAFCPNDGFLSGTTCRQAEGECDKAEVCSGSSPDCPADSYQSASFKCRAADGDCDAAEYCTGFEKACPNDSYMPATFTCRQSVDLCDVAEKCTGSSKACPADAVKPSTAVCRQGFGECDNIEYCTGTSAECPSDSYLPFGAVCRESQGACDIAETCSGASAKCPPNTVQPTNTACRESQGGCDAPEVCDGSSATCPTADGNVFAAGTVCRESTGPCDKADICDGASPACPNAFEPATVQCREANGACDLPDFCSGLDATCPDATVSAGTTCRAANGTCDIPETCDGTSKSCPADAFLPDTTVCRETSGDCDREERCSGSSAQCPTDSFQSGVECRASQGGCDAPEVCDGSSATCPTADGNVFAAGTVCRESTGPCDKADICDGASPACPNAFEPATVQCREANGACDLPDFCSGLDATCPDTFKNSSVVCRPQNVAADGTTCDTEETCSGTSALCPEDGFLAASTTCRAANGLCDAAEVCTGASGVCPADSVAVAGTVCRDSIGPCDPDPETCDGNVKSCPPDTSGACTGTCSSTSGACQSDVCLCNEDFGWNIGGCLANAGNGNGNGNNGGPPMPPEVCTTDNRRVMLRQGNAVSQANTAKYEKNPNAWWKWFDEMQGSEYANQWHSCNGVSCQKVLQTCTSNCLGTVTCDNPQSQICDRIGGMKCIFVGTSGDFRICSSVEDSTSN